MCSIFNINKYAELKHPLPPHPPSYIIQAWRYPPHSLLSVVILVTSSHHIFFLFPAPASQNQDRKEDILGASVPPPPRKQEIGGHITSRQATMTRGSKWRRPQTTQP